MSVYGSLYSAVSGIRAQGVAIGIISDNISNVNTVGYKAGSQQFGTLVTNSGGASSYSPGGVRAQSRQLISQQGLVQTTSSPLDIAIQGNGMFVVATGPNGITAGESIAYSRAGNFGTDSNGNFLNAAGYYLQAWPLDSNGSIPSNSSSLGTLQTVNIGEAFGEAAATTTVALKVNLDASEITLKGSGQIGIPGTDGTNTENQAITGTSIIVPNANLGLNTGAAAGTAAALAATTAANTGGNTSVAAGSNAATAGAAAVAAAAGVIEVTAVAGAATAVSAAGAAAITSAAATSAALGATASAAATTAGNTASQTSVATGGNSAAAGAAVIAAAIASISGSASVNTAITNAGNAAIAATAAAATAAGNAANTSAGNAANTAGTAQIGNGAAAVANAARDAAIAVAAVTSIPGAIAVVTAAANAARDQSIIDGDSDADTLIDVEAAIRAAAQTAAAAGTTGAAVVTATALAASNGIAATNTVTAAVAAASAAANLAVKAANADFDGDSFRVTTASTFDDDFVYGGFSESGTITSGILGASTATQPFNGAGIVASGDSFSIVVNGDAANPIKFTYVPSSPVTEQGEFNSLQTLAEAINRATGLNARVAEVNGSEIRLYVSAEDARQSIAYTAVSGTANFPTALGLSGVPPSAANRWNTLEGLAKLASNETQGRLKAEVLESTSTNARINIYNANPLTTIQFANQDSDVNAAALGNFLSELQVTATLQDPSYDAVAGSTANSMAAGNITPDFERTFSVFDSLGQEHELRVGFVKVGTNAWRAELYATDPSEIVSTVTGGDADDRFIAAASVTFDGSGNLSSISPNWVTSPPLMRWTSGASTSNISIDVGSIGLKDGLSQSSGLYTSNVTQNGAAVGLLDTVSIDDQGFVIANFNNGQSKKLYKIPLATFANYEGMQSRNGNVFIQTLASGDVNLAESGSGGAGSIIPESLETSNSELSEELTDMIVAQRAYQASAKVITTADELLDELNRI